jgi:hypothetical protein
MVVCVIVILMICCGTKSRNLDDLATETYVSQPETPADQTAIAKQGPYLLGRRIRRDIEIFGVQLQYRVAHAAADEKCLISGLVQPVQHFQRAI